MDGEKGKVRDPFIRSFVSFAALEDYAEIVDDREIKARVKVVKKHTFKIPRLVSELEKNEQPDANQANIILTTAHKSKGNEWDQVVLGDDFSESVNDSGTPRASPYLLDKDEYLDWEEANLIYVAATRAKKNLVLNEDLDELMRYFKK